MLDLADPDRYKQPECVLDNQITCLEAQYVIGSLNDTFRMNMRNNYPKAINLTDLTVTLQDSTISSSNPLNSSNGIEIAPGTEQSMEYLLPSWGQDGYVSQSVATTIEYTLTFAPVDSGNKYNKSGYTVVRAQQN